jgi:hypothetical protein
MFVVHETLQKKKKKKKWKNEKIMQWQFIKLPPISYGNVFFIIRRDYYAFIAKYVTPKNEFQVSSQKIDL